VRNPIAWSPRRLIVTLAKEMPELVTIIAALIAGAVSLVAITLSKEQKISEFRQAWIDALRADLASFLSSARAFARAMDARNVHGVESKDPGKTLFTLEKVGEIRATAAESYYRIKLRLNPGEADHKELLRGMSWRRWIAPLTLPGQS